LTTRNARRAAVAQRPSTLQKATLQKIRPFIFVAVVVGVLTVGAYLAFGDFLNRGSGATAGAIDIQSSMAGFTPSEIKVKAGTTVKLDWWTQDAAPHLTNGVHTMISTDLGLSEELPAESRKTVTWQVPNKPGTYDVWCDSCCGGKEAPQMHGKIVIEA
jgi:cytochrome c oxidase subunit 2